MILLTLNSSRQGKRGRKEGRKRRKGGRKSTEHTLLLFFSVTCSNSSSRDTSVVAMVTVVVMVVVWWVAVVRRGAHNDARGDARDKEETVWEVWFNNQVSLSSLLHHPSIFSRTSSYSHNTTDYNIKFQ